MKREVKIHGGDEAAKAGSEQVLDMREAEEKGEAGAVRQVQGRGAVRQV